METASVQQPVTAWFRADQFHPALPGYYQVRNSRPLSSRSLDRLVGTDLRYWDGSRWLTWMDGPSSVFGRHDSHEWRGRRMWVLQIGSVFGGLYFIRNVRGGRATYNSILVKARTFDSKAQADAFIKRFDRRFPTDIAAVLA